MFRLMDMTSEQALRQVSIVFLWESGEFLIPSLLSPCPSGHHPLAVALLHHYRSPFCSEAVLGATFKDTCRHTRIHAHTLTHSSLAEPETLSFPDLWITLFSMTETSVCIEQDVFAKGQDGLEGGQKREKRKVSWF